MKTKHQPAKNIIRYKCGESSMEKSTLRKGTRKNFENRTRLCTKGTPPDEFFFFCPFFFSFLRKYVDLFVSINYVKHQIIWLSRSPSDTRRFVALISCNAPLLLCRRPVCGDTREQVVNNGRVVGSLQSLSKKMNGDSHIELDVFWCHIFFLNWPSASRFRPTVKASVGLKLPLPFIFLSHIRSFVFLCWVWAVQMGARARLSPSFAQTPPHFLHVPTHSLHSLVGFIFLFLGAGEVSRIENEKKAGFFCSHAKV